MTVGYMKEVATIGPLTYLRLLARWRGSIWKSIEVVRTRQKMYNLLAQDFICMLRFSLTQVALAAPVIYFTMCLIGKQYMFDFVFKNLVGYDLLRGLLYPNVEFHEPDAHIRWLEECEKCQSYGGFCCKHQCDEARDASCQTPATKLNASLDSSGLAPSSDAKTSTPKSKDRHRQNALLAFNVSDVPTPVCAPQKRKKSPVSNSDLKKKRNCVLCNFH
uniref:Bestrophin homolog n=1 Tax=Ditylenchus dipsaci TaxID=166011 RepID=A0A915DC19_9BILA